MKTLQARGISWCGNTSGLCRICVSWKLPAAVGDLCGNLRVPVSPLSVVLAFVVSCSTGLFFGYLPANQAAKLQPIESLRYE